MTYSKLPGVYFTESVSATHDSIEREYYPCFIVQTSTDITSIDEKLTQYTSFSTFQTIANNKGLTKTLKYMEQVLAEYQNETFYVYSIKTDTAANFTSVVEATADREDIIDFIYIEETKSGSSNTIAQKIGAIQTGLEDNSDNGVFRVCTVIPYGTVKDAVTNKESGVTSEQAVITNLTSILTGISSGRICVALPDDAYCGIVAGRLISTDFTEEAGYSSLYITDSFEYNFNYTQMVTLQNLGVCFVREELVRGVKQYRINLGVTTSFASSSADGLLKARKCVDAVLRDVKWTCDGFVKSEDVVASKTLLQGEITGVVDDYIADGYLLKSTTINKKKYTSKLKVTASDRISLRVAGTLVPTNPVIAINVETTLV